jgi:outer membrane protein TolC
MKRILTGVLPLIACMAWVAPAGAAPPAIEPPPPTMTREAAVRYALEHNPQLEVVRQQRGIATAGVVLAKIYPYNPVFQSVELGVNGPASAGVTNHLFNENYAVLQIELFGQGAYRRAAADAAVTRTEWEIATQEIATAVSVVRAYDTVLYREQKLKVIDETIRLNEELVAQGRRLLDAGRLRAADLILARTELDAARVTRGQGRTALAVARAELRRLLGTLEDGFAVGGELDPPLPNLDTQMLTPYAVQLRPEMHARAAAVAEAEARLKLQVADRFGNPAVGPRVDYNETRANFIGVVVTGPIPVINRRQGEIAQRRADVARAQADLRSTETQVALAVQAALARLAEARKWADEYPAEVLPNLEKARQDLERLFAQNDPGVDLLRVLGVQRNLLRATDAYIDARFEVSQARSDLAAAVGDPALATGSYKPACEPRPPADPRSP